MLSTIRNRMILIGLMILASIFYLFPSNATVRVRNSQGVMHDTTQRRIPIKFGLDLQGGMHLALTLDTSNVKSTNFGDDINKALTVLRKRTDEFGVQASRSSRRLGPDQIVVELAGSQGSGARQGRRHEQRIARVPHDRQERCARRRALPSMDNELRRLGVKTSSGAAASTGKGVAALLNNDTSKKKTPGDTTKAKGDTAGTRILGDLIHSASDVGLPPMPGEYAVMETAYPRVDSLLHVPEVRRLWPRGVELFWSRSPQSIGTQSVRTLYALADKAIVDGKELTDATAQIDPLTQKRIVNFTLTRAGGRIFGTETGKHVGDYMAIMLSGFVEGAPPVIQSRIDQHGQIEMGNRSLAEANDLALTLKAGALPVPLKIIDDFQVGASLGADSIRDGVTAGVVGALLVIIIMIGYYRFAGVLAVAALALYVLFTLAGLAAINATLTLPGLAGLVLSIGIAVDANVLIFERIREELIAGKSVRLSVEEGFKHAMNAIIDSNVSTVLTALFLFQFGTGPVKGFSVTLIMGIAASMVTAVFVTKTFFLLWLDRRPTATTLSI